MQPYFSVIIPTYNRDSRIKATVESVINQTFEDWEIVIVDDASTDNTYEVLEPYLKKYSSIVYLKNEQNLERSMSRNKGLEYAQGKYICFLDSDDHYLPNHLSICYKEIQSKEDRIAMFFTGYTWNFPDKIKKVVLAEIKKGREVEWMIENQVAPSATVIHKDILKEFKFNPALVVNEDVELFSRICSKFPLIKIEHYTINFYVHDQATKSLYKDYITPQIRAHKLIYSNPLIKNKISKEFKTEKLKNLYFIRVQLFNNSQYKLKAIKESLNFIVKYPNHSRIKEVLVIFIYNLPVFGFVFKLINSLIKR